mmetsp:Transcript_4783/g.7760  ORF Transcript_4783/g.7760 Transcript_4783/m.7760 type:complete len:108 (-) Transcript_4783:484-807(-)
MATLPNGIKIKLYLTSGSTGWWCKYMHRRATTRTYIHSMQHSHAKNVQSVHMMKKTAISPKANIRFTHSFLTSQCFMCDKILIVVTFFIIATIRYASYVVLFATGKQ